MTDTWSVFTSADLFLGLLGAVGFLSVVVVIVTATGRVNRREKTLRVARTLQNMAPEEQVLEDIDPDFSVPDNYYGDGDYYETSGK
jgi:hypothetical protein